MCAMICSLPPMLPMSITTYEAVMKGDSSQLCCLVYFRKLSHSSKRALGQIHLGNLKYCLSGL